MRRYNLLFFSFFLFLFIIIPVILFSFTVLSYWYFLCSRKANFYVIHVGEWGGELREAGWKHD